MQKTILEIIQNDNQDSFRSNFYDSNFYDLLNSLFLLLNVFVDSSGSFFSGAHG